MEEGEDDGLGTSLGQRGLVYGRYILYREVTSIVAIEGDEE